MRRWTRIRDSYETFEPPQAMWVIEPKSGELGITPRLRTLAKVRPGAVKRLADLEGLHVEYESLRQFAASDQTYWQTLSLIFDESAGELQPLVMIDTGRRLDDLIFGQVDIVTPVPPGLSPRQLDVFLDLLAGLNIAETAERLGISWERVRAHRKTVLKRAGCKNQVALLRRALLSRPAPRASMLGRVGELAPGGPLMILDQ